MTNENVTCLVQAERSAWPRAFGIVLSCAVAAVAVGSTTAAYARMGENAATTRLELTDGDTVQRSCDSIGTACGDDSAVSGNFGGIWRDAAFVEPDPRTFPGILFIGKVISATQSGTTFDVYCSTEAGEQACVKIQQTAGGGSSNCEGIIQVQHNACTEGLYQIEYDKVPNTVLKTCSPDVAATCLADDSALVTNGRILAYRALFDYDCVRYCYGGCCRF